jgi:predicted 3-demethylubiquinone-9 3-methyltransferase (glyoxalase superfamily)
MQTIAPQKITPFLWFDGQAEEAARFYASMFERSKVKEVTRYNAAGPGPEGSVMTVVFELEGLEFCALNGGPQFKFTPAISLVVHCETQAEVDRLWAKLSEGGAPVQCGWITDRFGLSWQIVPNALGRMLQDPDPARAKRVMAAMLGMVKLDIAGLERAYRAG